MRNERRKMAKTAKTALLVALLGALAALLFVLSAKAQWGAGTRVSDTFLGYVAEAERVEFRFPNGDTFAYEGERLRTVQKELKALRKAGPR